MERLLTKRLVESLGSFRGDGLPVTSVYLGLDGPRVGKQGLLTQFKDIVGKTGRSFYQGRSHRARTSIKGDLTRCEEFLEKIRKIDLRGLAMFSCSGMDAFETVGIAMPFRPHLIVASAAAVAPLIAALDEFKRIAVCLVDRRGARLYEYFMGRIEEVKAFSDEVPGRVRVGGWRGYEESRVTRHIASHELEHQKNVADVLFEQFKLRGFDWLFLGIRPELREGLERVLHTYVRDRLKGHIEASLKTSVEKVRQITMAMAEKLKEEENSQTVELLVGAASAGALAVAGLKKTLEALDMSAVRQLVIRSGLSHKGVVCEPCGHLGLRSSKCPRCGRAMTPTENVLEAAEETAAALGAEIRHIRGTSKLDDFDGLGAFLRFPVSGGAV